MHTSEMSIAVTCSGEQISQYGNYAFVFIHSFPQLNIIQEGSRRQGAGHSRRMQGHDYSQRYIHFRFLARQLPKRTNEILGNAPAVS